MLMNCGEARLVAAEHGLVGHLRPGHARTRTCPASSPCAPAAIRSRDAELAVGVPARRLPGHVHRHAAHRDREADREHPQPRAAAPTSSAGSSTCCGSSTSATSQPRQHDAAARGPHPVASSWPTACRSRRPTRSTSASEPQHIREHVRRRARRPGRCLIARRLLERGVRFVQVWHGAGPAVGQPRRHRSQPPPAWPASATRRSPRCSPT